MTDGIGLLEHARLTRPREETGYCTDDAGRALALACRLPDDPAARRIASVTLGFLERAHLGRGTFRLRLGPGGRWTEDEPSDDAAGRALLGLGTAAARAPWPELRNRAAALFEEAARFRSPWPRAAAYSALGAAALLAADPDHVAARRLLGDAADQAEALFSGGGPAAEWPWPEPRLTYANALLPDAGLAEAAALGRPGLAEASLALLEWLIAEERSSSSPGRFSFTPVSGRAPGERGPAFDQQPIEAWAMADACARALELTGARRFGEALEAAAAWFAGENDAGLEMFDPATGGGYDGLGPSSVNLNQGAESTMAYVSTLLAARSGRLAPRQAASARASSRRETEAVAAPTQRSAAP